MLAHPSLPTREPPIPAILIQPPQPTPQRTPPPDLDPWFGSCMPPPNMYFNHTVKVSPLPSILVTQQQQHIHSVRLSCQGRTPQIWKPPQNPIKAQSLLSRQTQLVHSIHAFDAPVRMLVTTTWWWEATPLKCRLTCAHKGRLVCCVLKRLCDLPFPLHIRHHFPCVRPLLIGLRGGRSETQQHQDLACFFFVFVLSLPPPTPSTRS